MMETASADKPDLIPGVDGEPAIQVVIPTQTSKVMPSASTVVSSGENDVHVKTDGLGTMQQRENSNPKSRCILILIKNCFVAFFRSIFIFEREVFHFSRSIFIFQRPVFDEGKCLEILFFTPPSLPPKKKKTGPCREGLPALEGCWLRHWARPRVVVLASALVVRVRPSFDPFVGFPVVPGWPPGKEGVSRGDQTNASQSGSRRVTVERRRDALGQFAINHGGR